MIGPVKLNIRDNKQFLLYLKVQIFRLLGYYERYLFWFCDCYTRNRLPSHIVEEGDNMFMESILKPHEKISNSQYPYFNCSDFIFYKNYITIVWQQIRQQTVHSYQQYTYLKFTF